MGFRKCLRTCIHHYSITQNGFPALCIPSAPSVLRSLSLHSGYSVEDGLVVVQNKEGCGGGRVQGPQRVWGRGGTADPLDSLHSGLRCYAKFHRNRRVTRRKGRCVEPETANGDQGSFINV